MKFCEYLDSPTFWLRRTSLATQKAINEAFAACALSNAQYEVLGHLWQDDGLEQRVLQERLRVTSPTLTGVIDGLIERELVMRHPSTLDARVKHVFLTDKGRQLERELGEQTAQIQARLLTGFTAAEATMLKEWLQRMARNIGGEGKCD